MIDYKVLWEAIKEPLREFVLAVIPGLLLYFGTINTWWAISIYGLLRVVDKYLHESDLLDKGLTRF